MNHSERVDRIVAQARLVAMAGDVQRRLTILAVQALVEARDDEFNEMLSLVEAMTEYLNKLPERLAGDQRVGY